MARKLHDKPPIDDETIDLVVAKAVTDGDFVNFHQIFGPISPLRAWTPENVYTEKYAYLIPLDEEETTDRFQEALELVRLTPIAEHVRAQLEKRGPAQLHAGLLIQLADNAVRLGKYSSAAQAYELLRMRPRMREAFFQEADTALDAGDVPRAVQGYRIAVGLAYNYAAFPEPLPAIPDYQTRALMLHADYPTGPENCVPLYEPRAFVAAALAYLLHDNEAAARLQERDERQLVAFLAAYVRACDPNWEAFAQRYRQACEMAAAFGRQFEREANREEGVTEELAGEIEEQRVERDPSEITACLLGRSIEDGAWWQYLKELAYAHPAAPLFVARQATSKEREIIMPRYREDSLLTGPLGLETSPKAAR
ncbi:MAG: hypothetical protein ACLFTT_01485 [Candidatus Hydrogenedentota bacterium]